MTVAELIQALSHEQQDALVEVYIDGFPEEVTEVYFKEGTVRIH